MTDRKQQIDEDPGSYSKHSSLEHVVVILLHSTSPQYCRKCLKIALVPVFGCCNLL